MRSLGLWASGESSSIRREDMTVSMSEVRTTSALLRSLQLEHNGIRRLTVEVPLKFGAGGRALVRRKQNLPSRGHVWSSSRVAVGKSTMGIVVTVHVFTGKKRSEVPPFIEMDFRKGAKPSKSDLAFNDLLILLGKGKATADSREKTFVHAEYRAGQEELRLPLALPVHMPEIEPLGEITGYRLQKRRDGKQVYGASIDTLATGRVRVRLDFGMATSAALFEIPALAVSRANALFETLFGMKRATA